MKIKLPHWMESQHIKNEEASMLHDACCNYNNKCQGRETRVYGGVTVVVIIGIIIALGYVLLYVDGRM